MRALLVLLFSVGAFAQTTCVNCLGGGGGGGGGSVSSVGLSMPPTFCSVTSSPVTSAGTITCSYATGQTGNLIFGTDGSGNVGLMNLTASQLPNPGASTLGGVRSFAPVSHQFLTGISISGVPSGAQPSFSDLSGSVAATQLPNPSATTLGGVESLAASTNLFLTSISTLGVPVAAQPTFANLSGSAASTQMPAFSGDCTTSAGATALNCTKTAGALFATSATTDTTNASNITTGTLAAARLPNPSASTLGGVQSAASVSHQWINSISTSGIPALSQPACADISNAGTSCTVNTGTSGATLGLLNGNLTFSGNDIHTGSFAINKNAASLPSAQADTLLQLGNADGSNSRVEMDSFAGSGFFTALRYNGTAASPTGLLANDQIGGYNAWGYNGSSVSGPQVSFRTFASQIWTPTHLGTYADIATTANNATTLTGVIRFENDGGITVPSTVTGGDQGAGTVNAAGLYVNGASVNNTAILTSGTLSSARLPAFTGDCTTSAGASAVTCTQINGANFTVNTSGTATKVGGVATTGTFGVPGVFYKVDTGNINTTIAATTIFTPSTPGFYRVSVYGSQIDTGTNCTGSTTVGNIGIQYSDGFTANNFASSFLMIDTGGSSHNGTSMLTLGSGNTTGTTSQGTSTKTLYMGTGHAVQYQATSYTPGSGCTVNPNYRLIFVIEGVYQ